MGVLRCTKCNAAIATPIRANRVKDKETLDKVIAKMQRRGVLVVKVKRLVKKTLFGRKEDAGYRIYYRK